MSTNTFTPPHLMTDRYQQLKLQLASVPLPHPTAPHRNGSLCCCCCCCWMLFCSTAWTCYSYIRVCCWDEGTGYTRVADCDMRFIVMLHRLLWKVLNVVRYWSPSLNGSHPHRTASNSSPFVVAECMCSTARTYLLVIVMLGREYRIHEGCVAGCHVSFDLQ